MTYIWRFRSTANYYLHLSAGPQTTPWHFGWETVPWRTCSLIYVCKINNNMEFHHLAFTIRQLKGASPCLVWALLEGLHPWDL